MLSQQLHYHDADVRVNGTDGLIWLSVEDKDIQTTLFLRDAAQARDIAARLAAYADSVEAAASQQGETPAETLANA